jgi:signal transduction histidine kinase
LVPKTRSDVLEAIQRARDDLDRNLASLEALADEDRQRVSYSIHALNNYLMVVATTIQLLKRTADFSGDHQSVKWLNTLRHATELMMSTARGVLTASQDSPIPPLVFEPASLTEIAESACRSYREIARRKRVRITWRPPSRRDLIVTDRVAAGAVLDNLLSNAIKYSGPGMPIDVTTRVHKDNVVCFVRDKGPGLSETDQAKLFQRGVPLSARTTGGESSTGYGLAIASDLTKALGGSLACTSVLGEGSCFTFRLPLAGGGTDRRKEAPAESAVIEITA